MNRDLLAVLRCLECNGESIALEYVSDEPGYPELGPDGRLICEGCGEQYPLIAGTIRMLPQGMRSRLSIDYPLSFRHVDVCDKTIERGDDQFDVKQRTADSFAYEWHRFGALRTQWQKNFVDYMRPHTEESFKDRFVLDVGAGSGRHSFYAAEFGARVIAVDLGRSIDVARANLPPSVLTVQADAEHLPFRPGAFDFVMSIGVLHHMPDPQRALARIASLARPRGYVHIYLYWIPEQRWHASVLHVVNLARRITIQMPHRLLHTLCIPLAAVLAVTVVWPYRVLRRFRRFRRVAGQFPLKTYADYPFGVLVNDQFDRFSAPLERRYSHTEVVTLLEGVGLTDVTVTSNHGWIGDGQQPEYGSES